MKPYDKGCLSSSEVYFYTAPPYVKNTFFYPLCAGHYQCTSDYCVTRNNYDSYLLMYIKKGRGCLSAGGRTWDFHEGQAVLVNCYLPHIYKADSDMDFYWVHFDGATSGGYADLIYQNIGHVMTLKNALKFEDLMEKIFLNLSGSSVDEVSCSKYIVELLSEILLLKEAPQKPLYSDSIEDIVSYISNNVTNRLSLNELAERAGLSPYYFTRIFKQQTGYTPHNFIILARINVAKFYLKSSTFSIKEICYISGFSGEATFCSTFKRIVGVSPARYRSSLING